MAAQPPQPPLKPPSKVSTQAIQKAVKALLKWHSANPKLQNPSSSSEFLYLVTTLNQIPQNFRPQNPYKIPLPNPLTSPHSPTFTICLIVEDRFAKSSKQKIEAESLPISNVIKLSKLKSDYNSFEKKKELCESYDAFFADWAVVPDLPRVLGRYFYKRKKAPVGLELSRADWLEQIEEACGSARLSLKSGGTCSVVQVASLAMRKEEIVENVVAAVGAVANVVPKKWRNVKLFHLKLAESLALPIYEAGGGGLDNGEVGGGGIVGEKRRKEMDLANASSKKGKVLV